MANGRAAAAAPECSVRPALSQQSRHGNGNDVFGGKRGNGWLLATIENMLALSSFPQPSHLLTLLFPFQFHPAAVDVYFMIYSFKAKKHLSSNHSQVIQTAE